MEQLRRQEMVFIKQLIVSEIEYPELRCTVPFYGSKPDAMGTLMIVTGNNKVLMFPLEKSHVDDLIKGLQMLQAQPVHDHLVPKRVQVFEKVEELTYDRKKA